MNPLDLLPQKSDGECRHRLFCFPHAGGGSAAFYRWQRYCPPTIKLVPMRLPGREDRVSAEPYQSLDSLADDAAAAIRSLDDRPYSVLGHSLGAYVALEVTRRLTSDNGPPPSHLIVAGCGAPRETKRSASDIANLPDNEFVDEMVRRYDGIPEAVRNDPELLSIVLPPLRADMHMIETYEHAKLEPLHLPIFALGGTEDPAAARERVEQWGGQTTGQFDVAFYPGGHFFLHPPTRRDSSTGDTVPPALAAVFDYLRQGM